MLEIKRCPNREKCIMNVETKGYFGLGMSMAQLGDDKLVSFILGALVEIPGI